MNRPLRSASSFSFAFLAVLASCGDVPGLGGTKRPSDAPDIRFVDDDPVAQQALAHHQRAHTQRLLLDRDGPAVEPVALFVGWNEAIDCYRALDKFVGGHAHVHTADGEVLDLDDLAQTCRGLAADFEAHRVTTCGFLRVFVDQTSLGGGAWNEPQVRFEDSSGYLAEEPRLAYTPCGELPASDTIAADDDPRVTTAVRATCGGDLHALEVERWIPITEPDLPPRRGAHGKCWLEATTQVLEFPDTSQLRAWTAADSD